MECILEITFKAIRSGAGNVWFQKKYGFSSRSQTKFWKRFTLLITEWQWFKLGVRGSTSSSWKGLLTIAEKEETMLRLGQKKEVCWNSIVRETFRFSSR